jgi:NitT/TauT family transport system ATP-binding protein
MVAQLEKPTIGSLQVNSQKISYVFQEPRLIPWKTVKDNLLFVCPDGPYTEFLKKLELYDCENYYPVQLSGGMAQRVNLARALLAEPDLLILDEAFFALDIGIKRKVMNYLLSFWEEKQFTLIFVTHDIKEALLLSNKILILTQKPSRIRVEYPIVGINNPSTTRFDLFKMESEIEQSLID